LVVFPGLLDDLFPGISIPRKRDMTLEKAIEDGAIEMGLQPEAEFQLKVKKEDKDNFNESVVQISQLASIVSTVEST
jgi:hypothetical protein